MKTVPFRAVILASLASLAMATSSSAITILQYGQTNPVDFKTATAAGGVTTITTNAAGFPGAIPVTITNIGGIILPPALSIAAFERWTVTSTGPALGFGTSILQPYSGTMSYTQNPDGTGINYLTVNFTGGNFSGGVGGNSASLNASDPPVNQVTFTSSSPVIQAVLASLGAVRLEAFSISFSGISPALGVTGGTVASFTGQNSGTFSAEPIPEPSGLVMAGTAMLASLGCLGWRRRQSSRA
jgi:hypothetical protein